MNPMDLELQLEACLQRLAEGATLEACLAAYPENRSTLEPLLRAALHLSATAPAVSLPSADQIDRMQAKVLTGLSSPPKVVHFPRRTLINLGLLAASVVLVLGVIVVLANNREDGESGEVAVVSTDTLTATTQAVTAIAQAQSSTPPVLSQTATWTATDLPTSTATPSATFTATHTLTLTPSVTATPLPSATPTITPSVTPRPSNTPPPAATLTQTPVMVGDAEELAVYVDITGSVAHDESVTVAGVPIAERQAGEFDFADGDVITVSGLLLEDGQLLIETARFATADEQATAAACPPDASQCDVMLLILADALDVDYAELVALSDGAQLGKGEIARIYLLAQAGAGDVMTLIARRAAGESWRDLLPANASQLNNGVNLGNGKGQTIRTDIANPVYPGNSGNAPGQSNRPTARSPSNGNGGNNGNNGNNGNGANNGNGNAGNGNNGNGNGNNGNGKDK